MSYSHFNKVLGVKEKQDTMKLRTLLRAKGLLLKMVLWSSASVLLIVGILSVVIYLNAQNLMINKEYDNSKKILYQVKYNTNLMNETISRLTQSLYLNSDVNAIMYAEKEDMVNVITRINNVGNSVTSANQYVHSISIYNQKLNQFYNAGSPVFFNDPMLLDLFHSDRLIPILKPVFRDIHKVVNGKTESEPVFSYFMYETTMNQQIPSGAVVINVKPAWLLENIKQINMINNQKGDNIFILDQHGDYVDEGIEQGDKLNWLKNEFVQYKNSHSQAETEGFFKSSFKETQFLVTYTYIDSISMTLLKIQPTLEVYGYIESFKTSIMVITLIFLAMAVVISVSVSRKIYSPIGNLVSIISSGRAHQYDKEEIRDEISYLDFVYKQSMEQLNLYDKERYQYRDVMKHYWLNRLLTESLHIGNVEMESMFREMKIALPLNHSYAVLLLKIDNYKHFQQSFSTKDKETIRFAMINIVSELVSNIYINEGLDLKDDHVVIIVSVPPEEQFETDMISLLKEAQQFVNRFYKITFTASISAKTDNIQSLHTVYNKALDQSIYRFIFGHQSIIDTNTFRHNEGCRKTGYSKNLEVHLQEALRKRDLMAIEETMKLLFNEVTELNYSNALVSTFRLVELTKMTLESSTDSVTPSLLIDLSSLSLHLMEKETINDIYETMLGSIKDSFQVEAYESTNKLNHYVVDAVTDYIRTHYDDPSLCLASIASMMKITSRRLGNLFKEAMAVSVADFINETRLTKAAELLAESEISVREVVEKVGVLNETYFFSLFKKRFGATPKEYALKNQINHLRNTD
jgi:AraC-like DNA-binding protein